MQDTRDRQYVVTGVKKMLNVGGENETHPMGQLEVSLPNASRLKMEHVRRQVLQGQ